MANCLGGGSGPAGSARLARPLSEQLQEAVFFLTDRLADQALALLGE